jgi:hypothetical protein
VGLIMILLSIICAILKWSVFSTFRVYTHPPCSMPKRVGAMNSNVIKADGTIDGHWGRGGALSWSGVLLGPFTFILP